MRAQNYNSKAAPPSGNSLLQDKNRINTPKNLSNYRVFLYSEAKRQSNYPVDIQEIDNFINSPEGQKGLALFISIRKPPKEITRPKALSEVLGAVL